MTMHDTRGNPLSTDDVKCVESLDRAAELFMGWSGDPLSVVDAALERQPDFVMGHCFRAALLASATDTELKPELRRSVETAEQLAARANPRERRHIAAVRAWLDGDMDVACERYGDLLVDYPRDALALMMAHTADFYLGQSESLRDRIARCLPHWSTATPGYGYVLGMYAFGLEETGNYAQAEENGRRAVELQARDPWAIHAVAHVMEMQGRHADGIAWLNRHRPNWESDCALAPHNWWHLALLYLDLGEIDQVLALYDSGIRATPTDIPLDLVDACAMLWRLELRGVDVGGRWKELADIWEAKSENGDYAFNDIHAMMAFVGDQRRDAAMRLLALLDRRSRSGTAEGRVVASAGLPISQALWAWGQGDYAKVVDTFEEVRHRTRQLGGSNAQRDLFRLTAVEAALRSRQGARARAIAAERTAVKPSSPWNWSLAARAMDLTGEAGEAARARRKVERLHQIGSYRLAAAS